MGFIEDLLEQISKYGKNAGDAAGDFIGGGVDRIQDSGGSLGGYDRNIRPGIYDERLREQEAFEPREREVMAQQEAYDNDPELQFGRPEEEEDIISRLLGMFRR